MALKITKIIRDSSGNVTEELEGTEAEIEAYERKKQKREQSESAKRERKLLLDSKKTLDKLTKKDLQELIQKLLEQAAPKTTEHHHYWYYNNGWWWKPAWEMGRWVYYTSNTNPTLTSSTASYTLCTSIDDLTKRTGVEVGSVYSSLLSANGNQNPWYNGNQINGGLNLNGLSSQNYGSSAVGVYTSQVLGDGSQDISYTAADNTAGVTSGIVNLNMKS